jgi:hypothetical protein
MSPVLRKEKVGSRITCRPPPADTDDDTLVLLKEDRLGGYVTFMTGIGWSEEGRTSEEYAGMDRTVFVSLRKGEQNYICTESVDFFNRFMAATALAMRFNLLKKADRVALFQAVLYGKPYTVHALEEDPLDALTDDIPFHR